MKFAGFLGLLLVISACCFGQNVGIGTTLPELKLTIDDDGGLLAKGNFGAGSVLTTAGLGSRMIWYPRKAAFRAGAIDGASDGTNWNETNIGDYSVAMGRNTRALNTGDVALGTFNIAGGGSSVSLGYFTNASGFAAMATGYASQASAQAAFAGNSENSASGYSSAAFGTGNMSRGYATFSVGQFNDPVLSSDQPFSSDGTMNTPLFIVGNGSGPDNRSNAIVSIKNGESGFGKNPSTGNFSDARVQIRGRGSNDILRIENATGDKFWSFWINSGNSALQFLYRGNFRGSFDTTSGNYLPVSDRRMKKQIEPLQPVLASLLALPAYTYRYALNADNSPLTYGFMAQDIQQFFPSLVREIPRRDGLPILTVDYTGLHAITFKAIQEQQELIRRQQQEIDALNKRLSKLEQEHSGMEKDK